MNANDARALYEDYLRTIYHERQIEQLARFFTPDVVAHPSPPGVEPGLPGVKVVVQAFLDTFSDIRITLDGIIHEGDRIAPRVTIQATHAGPFLGVPATGQRVQFRGFFHYRLQNGKMAEYWTLTDTLTVLQQIGAFPAPVRGG